MHLWSISLLKTQNIKQAADMSGIEKQEEKKKIYFDVPIIVLGL